MKTNPPLRQITAGMETVMKHLTASVLIIQLHLAGGVAHAADSDVPGAAASYRRGCAASFAPPTKPRAIGFAIRPAPEGEELQEGDILATFECGDIQAQLKSAEAAMAAAKIALPTTNGWRARAAGKFEVGYRAEGRPGGGRADAYRSKLGRFAA